MSSKLMPEYEVAVELQSGELKYVMTLGEAKLVPDDYYYDHLMNSLLMIINHDAELIKKKYCQ